MVWTRGWASYLVLEQLEEWLHGLLGLLHRHGLDLALQAALDVLCGPRPVQRTAPQPSAPARRAAYPTARRGGQPGRAPRSSSHSIRSRLK